MPRSAPNLFADQLAYIAKVTELLNTLPYPDGPTAEDIILEIRLVDSTGMQYGFWCDEIGPDAWYFQPEHAPNARNTEESN